MKVIASEQRRVPDDLKTLAKYMQISYELNWQPMNDGNQVKVTQKLPQTETPYHLYYDHTHPTGESASECKRFHGKASPH